MEYHSSKSNKWLQEGDENPVELHVSILRYFSSLALDKYENSGRSCKETIERLPRFHKSRCATSVQVVRNAEQQQQEHLLYVPYSCVEPYKCVRFLFFFKGAHLGLPFVLRLLRSKMKESVYILNLFFMSRKTKCLASIHFYS